MKKLLALILATFMMISIFAACGGVNDKVDKENVEEKQEAPVEEKQEEETPVVVPEDIEKTVKAFVKAAILKEVDDNEYVVYEYIDDGKLREKYEDKDSPFGKKKSLADELAEKVVDWVDENIKDDDDLKEGIEGKTEDFLEGWLEKIYYSHRITDYTKDEETTTVKVEIERYDLSKLNEVLNSLLDMDDDVKELIKKQGLNEDEIEKLKGTIYEKIEEVATDSKILTTSELTLEKKDGKWLITNDGSLEPESDDEANGNILGRLMATEKGN